MDESQLETNTSAETTPQAENAVPQALERWGPFERLQRVGRGSFGEVYRAFDPALQRQVALKLLIPATPDPEAEGRAGGRILLMDFGLSHEHGRENHPSGTPLYMAPELLEGRPATVAGDIYALGVLLFNLLTTEYPVRGANPRELRAAHASGARRTLLDVRPDLPEELVVVVETAINPIPEKRFASAGRMAVALSDVVGLGSRAAAADVEPRKARVLRAWMLAPGAALAVAALFVLVPPLRPSIFAPRPIVAETPLAAPARDDYRQAHELLAHYYRPRALETVIPSLEKVVADDPQFAPAFADLARANLLQFVQQRDTKYIEPARTAALRALTLAPDLASPHVTLGALYARTSQNDLAGHELDEALRLDRFNAAAYGALADLYVRQGRGELVEPTLKKAVSLAPEDWSLVQQLGEHYLDRGRWQEAGEQYRRAIELVPDNSRAHNNLGLVYRGLDRLDEAAAAFRAAIALEPTFLRYRNLGMVLAEAGKFVEAVPMLQRSIDMRPDHYRAWGLLGFVYLNQPADQAKARDAFLKAVERAGDLLKATPRDEYLLADVGSYHAALGMDKDALPRLEQAAALAPDIPEVLYQVAVGYEMLRRRGDAVTLLAKAVAGGYPAGAIARNPLLAALRADAQYRAPTR